ncbi:MAG TPA: YceI family protein [Anaeromyxobacteraceae bacterium]|nr:YceI family protein [Anaeromyxobacteraceae bacterium]
MRTLSLLTSAAITALAAMTGSEGAAGPEGPAAPASASRLEATPASGRIVVHVFKKGLFSGFAHDHHFEVTKWRASADVPEGDPSRLSLEAVFDAGSLRDRQPSLSDADRAEVDATAAGKDVLDAARHPEIAWRSERVTLDRPGGGDGAARGTAHGQLTLRGRTRPVDVAFEARRERDAWQVKGKARAKQSDFGISPFSGFLGTVGVEDELEIEIALTLRPAARASASPSAAPGPEGDGTAGRAAGGG